MKQRIKETPVSPTAQIVLLARVIKENWTQKEEKQRKKCVWKLLPATAAAAAAAASS